MASEDFDEVFGEKGIGQIIMKYKDQMEYADIKELKRIYNTLRKSKSRKERHSSREFKDYIMHLCPHDDITHHIIYGYDCVLSEYECNHCHFYVKDPPYKHVTRTEKHDC